MSFAENLQKGRKLRNWNQDTAAIEIGVKRSAYAAWEENRSAPRLVDLKKVVDAFQPTDIYFFLFGEEKS